MDLITFVALCALIVPSGYINYRHQVQTHEASPTQVKKDNPILLHAVAVVARERYLKAQLEADKLYAAATVFEEREKGINLPGYNH